MLTRRQLLQSALIGGALASLGRLAAATTAPAPWFTISLAQWSLHRAYRTKELDPLDFAADATGFGIRAVEYVNSFYREKLSPALLEDLRRRADEAGVQSVLIMCDGEGQLGAPTEAQRIQTVDNHRKWLEAAQALGCHAIRVNAASAGTFDEQQKLAADGLARLCAAAEPFGIDVIVENHGGLSSHGAWLAGVMRLVDHPRCGTLPDFGNFIIDRQTGEAYDRYKGTAELLPFAKGVSAKTYDFDATGAETTLDYPRLLGLVRESGYRGHIGVEYEGQTLSEPDGIRATRDLLLRLGGRLESSEQPS